MPDDRVATTIRRALQTYAEVTLKDPDLAPDERDERIEDATQASEAFERFVKFMDEAGAT